MLDDKTIPGRFSASDASSRTPSPNALAAADALAQRGKGRSAQLRRIFIERADIGMPTPLARMIRGGRGGEVRLKTYMSMLFIAGKSPHDVSYPARAWATRATWSDAYAGLMSGSSPLPEAVSASAGIGPV